MKRFHVLLDALATCRERHPQLQAVIVGEGYEREHLERVRRELGADDWVSLPGSVSDAELLDLYRRAWVVASASAHEGWGMTLTEAAACGTPAVATRIPDTRTRCSDGRSGLLVGDVDEFAGALDRVLADADLRARLCAGALAARGGAHMGRDCPGHAGSARSRSDSPPRVMRAG